MGYTGRSFTQGTLFRSHSGPLMRGSLIAVCRQEAEASMVLSNKPQVYTRFSSETQHLDISPSAAACHLPSGQTSPFHAASFYLWLSSLHQQATPPLFPPPVQVCPAPFSLLPSLSSPAALYLHRACVSFIIYGVCGKGQDHSTPFKVTVFCPERGQISRLDSNQLNRTKH